MIIKKRFFKTLVAIFGTTTLIMTFAVEHTTAIASANTNKKLNAGEEWVVTSTTNLNSITIAEGSTIKAPEGYSVTLTVDGVGTAIKPGTYNGNIVLTVTKEIKVSIEKSEPYIFRTAVYVENGKYVPEKSVAAIVVGGKVTDNSASNIKITSNEEKFNGIIVTGDSSSTYSIINPVINLTGNGGDDSVGFGAAIMSSGKAEVAVENAKIINNGAIRTAILVKDYSIMRVNDSYIEVNNGILPADYKFTVDRGMMEVPWMLGLSGNVRATNLLDNGTAYYNNTHIKAQGWGALSVDGLKKVRLNATNCLIETLESGYGAYSMEDCIDFFSGCTFNVTDIGLIIAYHGSAIFTDGTVVNSGRFGVMMHSGTGGGTLTIDKGSVFNTKSTAIQIKGRGANIIIDNAKLNTENGIIIQTMANDDPFMSGGSRGGSRPSGNANGGRPSGRAGGGGPSIGAAGGGSSARPTFSTDVNATFSNMTLNGDIINSNTVLGNVNVTFENATITGAITTAIVKHALGPNGEELTMQHRELYKLVGEVTNTYCAIPENPYGVTVSLNEDSKWVVDKTSFLTGLNIADGAIITAPKGYSINMTVDGVKKPLGSGKYKGQIVIAVNK